MSKYIELPALCEGCGSCMPSRFYICEICKECIRYCCVEKYDDELEHK